MIVLGMQSGCSKSGKIFSPMQLQLNEIFEKHYTKQYCPSINEFSIILRVSGDIWSFEFEGCDKLRRNRKEKYITIDIGIPRTKWEGKEEIEIKQYLVDSLREAIALMIGRLKKDKEEVNENDLHTDLEMAFKQFM